jgi:hypothetical protein
MISIRLESTSLLPDAAAHLRRQLPQMSCMVSQVRVKVTPGPSRDQIKQAGSQHLCWPGAVIEPGLLGNGAENMEFRARCAVELFSLTRYQNVTKGSRA